MSLDGIGVILVVETVLRAIEPVVGVVPLKTTAGLDVRRKTGVIRLMDLGSVVVIVCGGVGILTDPVILLIARLEMPVTARRTIVTFDETESGR